MNIENDNNLVMGLRATQATIIDVHFTDLMCHSKFQFCYE